MSRPSRVGVWRQVWRAIRFVTSPEAGAVPKLLALAVVVYLVSPIDLAFGPLDDAVVAWGAYMFLDYLMRRHDSRRSAGHRDAVDTTATVRDDEE